MTRHRSFRLSPEPYMLGKRVKRRLRCVQLAVYMLRLSLIIGGIAIFWAFVMKFPTIQPQSRPFGVVGAVGHLAIALLMNDVGFLLGRDIALRLGWLSASEASTYRRRMYQWPDNWLETRPGSLQRHSLDDDGGQACRAPEHSVQRILKSRVSVRAW